MKVKFEKSSNPTKPFRSTQQLPVLFIEFYFRYFLSTGSKVTCITFYDRVTDAFIYPNGIQMHPI